MEPSPKPPSEAELRVLAAIAEGVTHREAAARLYVSYQTVKTHTARMRARYGVGNTAALCLYAARRGWIEL